MVPHTMKRRKLAHDTNSAHESGHSSIHNQTTDDDERNNSSDDYNVISSAPGDSRILQNVPSHTARIGSRNGPLLAREVYRSNIINLQIDELLEEVRPDYRTLLTGTERVLRKLKATIESLPKREPLTVRLTWNQTTSTLLISVSAGARGRKRLAKELQHYHSLSRAEAHRRPQI